MLHTHKPLIINWSEAKGSLSSGALEGLNLKAKLTMRKSFGFRSTESLKIAIQQTLGNFLIHLEPTDLAEHPFFDPIARQTSPFTAGKDRWARQGRPGFGFQCGVFCHNAQHEKN